MSSLCSLNPGPRYHRNNFPTLKTKKSTMLHLKQKVIWKTTLMFQDKVVNINVTITIWIWSMVYKAHVSKASSPVQQCLEGRLWEVTGSWRLWPHEWISPFWKWPHWRKQAIVGMPRKVSPAPFSLSASWPQKVSHFAPPHTPHEVLKPHCSPETKESSAHKLKPLKLRQGTSENGDPTTPD